ncbi:MAG: PaaI family thioesterase [Xanthomonadales bacterium]|nr:PaaI family thioesterase [Xanthomonadales bacterium]
MQQSRPRVQGYDLEELKWEDIPGAPWVDDALGLAFDLISPDRVEAHVEVGPQHHQPYGIVHGGVYCSMVETLASVAGAMRVLAQEKIVVGVSNTTDFLRATREGRLAGSATPVHVGRLQHLWQVEVARSDGKLAARGQVRLQVLDADRL